MVKDKLLRFAVLTICILLLGESTVAALEETGIDQDILQEVFGHRGTVLDGRSILFLGDSLLSGYGLEDYCQSWCGRLGTDYGMTTVNCALPASTFSTAENSGYGPGGCHAPFCERTLPEGNFDVVLVTGSGNDWFCEIPLGKDLDSRDTKTLMGAVNVVIDRLQNAYPNALVLFTTSWNSSGQKNGLGYTTEHYNQTVTAVCEHRGIPCFQACDVAISGIDASDSEFREENFLDAVDFWHLNPRGHRMYLPVIAKWLQRMIIKNYLVSGFYDVTVHDWYADAVSCCTAEGITGGTSKTTFSPTMETQRGMLLCMLYRMAGRPDVTGLEQPFVDLKEGAYYYDAVIWAYHAGITQGIGNGCIGAEEPLTREQLAVFLRRYAGVSGMEGTEGVRHFSDYGEISDFAMDGAAWAVNNKILCGCGDGTLAPQRVATRGELIQILYNYKISLSK